jgi:hypothetical protein
MDDAAPWFDGVFHYDATCRPEACMWGLLLRLSRGISGLNTARDNSMVLQSRPFSNGRVVGIVGSSQNHTRPARITG